MRRWAVLAPMRHDEGEARSARLIKPRREPGTAGSRGALRAMDAGVGYAAAGWSGLFAVAHLYWALGGTAGLPAGFSVARNTALFIISLVAIPLCLIAGLLALSMTPRLRDRFRLSLRLRFYLGAATSALFLVHALPAMGDWVSLALGESSRGLLRPERFDVFVYEPFFLVGAVLFGAASYGVRRTTVSVSSTG
jgi:hypothetical protein